MELDGGNSGARTVLVGVKLDRRSRELLMWALVKVAEPGDLVIALHVLGTSTEDSTSHVSLSKFSDSVLEEYEGFCNLKQVDLEFRVCRGASARKLLVHEAKSLGAATILAGTSKSPYIIRSSVSVAIYCARKLPKCVSVLAVDNGKVVFRREATNQGKSNEGPTWSQNSISAHSKENRKVYVSSTRVLAPPENSAINPTQGLPDGHEKENSLASVPAQKADDVPSNSIMDQKSKQSRSGWSLLPRKYMRKSFVRNASVFKRELGKHNRHSSVHPDYKQTTINHNEGPIPKELLDLQEKYSSSCTLYSFQELASATSNFAPENLIGQGGSSLVYRGCLPDGKELAVKILRRSQDALKEFVLEIETMTALHHKNIISLCGFCFESNNLLLVYNLLSRGSLEANLHGNKNDSNVFSWKERYKVAVGTAEALDFLHNGCAQTVIHRDVKTANILLSDDFDPQLSDFGMACLNSSSHDICTDVVGTFGYMAPEYLMQGRMIDKIDVYAFGVVLLELLSSRKPINNEKSLVMWAKPILKGGKISELLDPSLGFDYDKSQIERMVLAATLCIRQDPTFRPQINLIVKLLHGDEEVTRWAQQEVCVPEELDVLDSEPVQSNDIQSHMKLALLDVEDAVSSGSPERSISVEENLQEKWSDTLSDDCAVQRSTILGAIARTMEWLVKC